MIRRPPGARAVDKRRNKGEGGAQSRQLGELLARCTTLLEIVPDVERQAFLQAIADRKPFPNTCTEIMRLLPDVPLDGDKLEALARHLADLDLNEAADLAVQAAALLDFQVPELRDTWGGVTVMVRKVRIHEAGKSVVMFPPTVWYEL